MARRHHVHFCHATLLSAAFATVVSAAHVTHLVPRDDEDDSSTCGGVSGLTQCGDQFPSNFCCPETATCQSIANTQAISVICCPAGSDCSYIEPVTCDVTAQNATLFPSNQIHTANLTNATVTLPTCGDACCPLGYACESQSDTCQLASLATATASASATSSPSTIPSASATAVVSTSSGGGHAFSGTSFAAGFIPGLALGVLLTVAVLCVLRRRKAAKKRRYSGDFGPVSRMVSDPIYNPNYGARTDFLRRNDGAASLVASTLAPSKSHRSEKTMVSESVTVKRGTVPSTPPRVRALFSRSPEIPQRPDSPEDPFTTPPRGKAAATDGRVRKTPTRSSSQETIDVLMPAPSFLQLPTAVGPPGSWDGRIRERHLTGGTTFSGLMESVGYEWEEREGVRKASRERPAGKL